MLLGIQQYYISKNVLYRLSLIGKRYNQTACNCVYHTKHENWSELVFALDYKVIGRECFYILSYFFTVLQECSIYQLLIL